MRQDIVRICNEIFVIPNLRWIKGLLEIEIYKTKLKTEILCI